ncbi:MAG: glutamate 5-kinase [Chloroflexi bacterium]|nr:glutamate 5-kinase [Chloroflexota bacterium]
MSPHRIVVKLGTSTLTGGTRQINRQRMLEIVQQVARLHQHGHEMVVVSSGAVTAGRERLGFPDLGRSVPAKQMLSAVGQGRLMHLYGELFDIFDIAVGQVLLTRDDLTDRPRYLNARDTLLTLIERRIIPIINENDTIATDEIRVGDNDNLSALVANLLEADLLVLLTDQPGLFTADPRKDSAAQLIAQVTRIDEQVVALAGGAGSGVGTGGMATKIQAAQLASRSGVTTVIASGKEPDVLARILAGERLGTRFEPAVSHLESRKRWLLADKPRGLLRVDSGAATKLLKGGASLLPVGVTAVEGEFRRGEVVAVFAPDGREIAHGLTSYDSADAARLRGVKSAQIVEILGYTYGDAVIHRNNLVVLI